MSVLITEEKTDTMNKGGTVMKKKNTVLKICIAAVVVVIIAIIAYVGTEDMRTYNKAKDMLESGEYREAMKVFKELGDYKDSDKQVDECTYQIALVYADEEKYEEALALFGSIKESDYKDSEEQSSRCLYEIGKNYIDEKSYDQAIECLKDLNYKDSAELVDNIENGTYSLNKFIERYNAMADNMKELKNVTIDKLDAADVEDGKITTCTEAVISFNDSTDDKSDYRYEINSFMWDKRAWILADTDMLLCDWYCTVAGFTPDSTYDSVGDILSTLTNEAGSGMYASIDVGDTSYSTGKTKKEMTLGGHRN